VVPEPPPIVVVAALKNKQNTQIHKRYV